MIHWGTESYMIEKVLTSPTKGSSDCFLTSALKTLTASILKMVDNPHKWQFRYTRKSEWLSNLGFLSLQSFCLSVRLKRSVLHLRRASDVYGKNEEWHSRGYRIRRFVLKHQHVSQAPFKHIFGMTIVHCLTESNDPQSSSFTNQKERQWTVYENCVETSQIKHTITLIGEISSTKILQTSKIKKLNEWWITKQKAQATGYRCKQFEGSEISTSKITA